MNKAEVRIFVTVITVLLPTLNYKKLLLASIAINKSVRNHLPCL